jgi:hypothetical protein
LHANAPRGVETVVVVPALVILALWAALLGPGFARWLRQHRPTTSVASFHRQLRGLEHSGPRLVEPAHRLGGTDWSENESHDPRREPERPQLVLLRTGATEKESTMRYDDRYDQGYDEPRATTRQVAPLDDPWDDPWRDPFDDESFEDPRVDPPTRAYRTVRAPKVHEYAAGAAHARHTPALTRDGARVRRTRILVALGAAIVGSFALGLVPGLTILWALTVLGVVALAAYLGLMYYASNIGLYGTTAVRTPVARVIVPAFRDDAYSLDDEDWADDRIAAAR